MTPDITPRRLDLKKDEKLTIAWADGRVCTYSIGYLRSMCPCASCKTVREGTAAAPPAPSPAQPQAASAAGGAPAKAKKTTRLTILPGNYAQPLSAVSAQLVGNYALKIEWSDRHASGIYSFEYLRKICPTLGADG
jgi:DUF971 family protein